MTDHTKRLVSSTCVNFGLLLVMAATAMPLLRIGVTLSALGPLFGWIYAFGALLILTGRLIRPKAKDQPLRVQRLLRMEVWTAIMFIVGAVFIFTVRGNDWIAFTMAGGVLTVYSAIMLSRNEKKH